MSLDLVVAVCQVVIGLGILNVWLLRFGKASEYRGGGASDMKEEFAVYGLPGWMVGVVGFLKVILALALLAGVWVEALTVPAALGMAVLMLGAVAMHVKVRDPVKKALPAATLLVLSVFVAVAA